MKIFAIKDKYKKNKSLAFLFCYPTTGECYIEIPKDTNYLDLPIILSHFAEKQQFTVDCYWTQKFIEERIIPSDRQNLGQILRDNQLDYYDPLKLLEISDGKCSQDDCYIKRISENDLPDEIKNRRLGIICECVPTAEKQLLVTFADDTTALFDMAKSCSQDWVKRILRYYDLFKEVMVKCGGSCVCWNDFALTYDYIRSNSQPLPVSKTVLRELVVRELVSTSEAMEILNCSRQNIDDLVKRGRLTPVSMRANTKMFYRSDITNLL